jgi:hypothetical protein
MRRDDECLDENERWARDRLEKSLGQLRVIDRSRKGGPPGLHDFEADLPGGSVAAVEVTSEVEPERLGVESEIRRRGLSTFRLPGVTSLWSVRLTDAARVKELSRRDELRQLLRKLEAHGERSAHDRGDYRDPIVAQLRALGVASACRLSTERAGVMMGTGAYAGFAWQGPAIDAWLGGVLASDTGMNKLKKLARAAAAERHLVIVLGAFSKAGLGIPLGLGSRHDSGAADYVMPSLEPPEPLTHLWLLPTVEDWEGLRWTRATGWAFFGPPAHAHAQDASGIATDGEPKSGA